MLALTRQKLLGHLAELPILINLYQRRDPQFYEKSIVWLASLETSLLQMRHPLAGMAATERGKALAIRDGYRDPDTVVDATSRRKISYATTVAILSRVEVALLAEIADIDARFKQWREKMAQFIAVATNDHPIPLPPGEPRQAWLEQIWNSFHVTPETRSMYQYLSTVMARSDRFYLLEDLIENLLDT